MQKIRTSRAKMTLLPCMPCGRVRGNGQSQKEWRWKYVCSSKSESDWWVGKAKCSGVHFRYITLSIHTGLLFFFFFPLSCFLFSPNVRLGLPKSHRQKCSFCQFYTVTSRLLCYMDFTDCFYFFRWCLSEQLWPLWNIYTSAQICM